MAVVNTLQCYRGEAYTPRFTMKPVESIAGWTIVFSLKDDYTDTAVLVTATGTLTDAANGVFTIPLTSAQTTLAPGNYVFDIWRTNAGSEIVLSEGPFIIQPDVRL